MSKIYEAFRKREKETGKDHLLPVKKDGNALPAIRKEEDNIVIPDWYKELKINLEAINSNKGLSVILFTGASRGVGCTTTCAEFSIIMARSFKRKILLIDIDSESKTLDKYLNEKIYDIDDYFNKSKEAVNKLYKQLNGNLNILSCKNENPEDLSSIILSDQFWYFLSEIKREFEFVIIDAPPLVNSPETKAVASMVDGAVLVLQSGKSRKKVAHRAIEELNDMGVPVLGGILNRKKFYIPNWIYKRL